MKIYCFSDTHGFHESMEIPIGTDIIICSGDVGNYRDLAISLQEVSEFMEWYEKLEIKHKLYVPGNHDTIVEKGMIDFKKYYPSITKLENESINISGVEIFGYCYCKQFNQWAYERKDATRTKALNSISTNVDILISHDAPKGILDYSYDNLKNLEHCGCKLLYNTVQRIKPKYHIFGHIHDNKDCYNHGLFKRDGITYVNCSCVEDGKFNEGLKHNGIEIHQK